MIFPSIVMQDALVKRYSSLSFDCQISTCTGLLEDGQGVLEQNEPDASMEYLEGIANMRYALKEVAELLHREPNTPVAKVATQLNKNVTKKQHSEERLSDSAEDKEEESPSQNELEPAEFQPLRETESIEGVTVDTPPSYIAADKGEQEQTAQHQETGGSVGESEENTQNTSIMDQRVAAQPSKDLTVQEHSKEGQISETVEDKEEECTSQNEQEPEFQPSVPTEPIEVAECNAVEIMDTQPKDISADKEQEQTAQPQKTGRSVDDSEESTQYTPIMVQTMANDAAQLSKDVTEDSKDGQLSETVEDKEEECTSQNELEPEFQPLMPTEPIKETECTEVNIVNTQPEDITANKEKEQTGQPPVTDSSVGDSEESIAQTVAKGGAQPSEDVTEDPTEERLSDGAENNVEEGTSEDGLKQEIQSSMPTEPKEETECIEIVDTQLKDITADKEEGQTAQPPETDRSVDDSDESTSMAQTITKEADQPSKDAAEDSKEESQLSDGAENKVEEGTSESGLKQEYRFSMSTEPIEESEHIVVEIVDTQPTDTGASKEQEQEQTEIGRSLEENMPELIVSTEENWDTGYTEMQETHQLLTKSASEDSDAGIEADPAAQLLLAAQLVCQASLTVGPSHYLLKLIVRQFGFSFLRKLVKVHPWVIPQDLTWTGEVRTHMWVYV